jgi:hypothetical protein
MSVEDQVTGPSAARLSELAELIPGYSEKLAADRSRGELRILQARDLDASGQVRWQLLDRCEAKVGSERARLRPNDVVLTVRAAEPRAARIDEPPSDVVAGATFAILRSRADVVDPRYLHWALGIESTRDRLRGLLRGSAMPFVRLADLGMLTIPLPRLSVQRSIASVHELRRRLAELAASQDHALGRLLEAVATHSPSS